MQKLFIYCVCVTLLLPQWAWAETVVRFAETVSVTDTQTIANDFYVLAGTAAMSGAVDGDMYVVGGSVTVNGPIAADFTAVSGRTLLSATVTDDVRLAAGEAVLSGPVGGDVFMFGGSLQILSTASVAGDVYMFGGEADIAGSVGGVVRGTYSDLRIDAPVGGVEVDAGRITLGAKADVSNNVTYSSPSDLVRAPEATIQGEIIANTVTPETNRDALGPLIISFLVLLFSVLVVFLLARTMVNSVARQVVLKPLLVMVIGFGLIVSLPFVGILLIVSSLGLLIGCIVLAFWFGGLIAAYVFTPVVFGAWLSSLFKQPVGTLVSVVSGAALFYGLSLLPVINVIVITVGMSVSFGAIVYYLYAMIRS